MDLRQARHVAALARLLSYTRAAEELGMSQSALSRSIQEIERAANVRLFDRDRGGVRPTVIGHALAERAALLLREADDIDRMLRQAATGKQPRVAFGIAPLPAAALLSSVLPSGLSANLETRTEIAVRSADSLLSLLLEEKIEFFISAEGQIPEIVPVRSLVLGWFPRSLLVRSGHPLLGSKDGGQLNNYPRIAAASFPQANSTDPGVVASGVQPILVLEDYGALARITECSDAVWVSSTFAAAAELREGRLCELRLLPMQAPQRFQMMLYSLDRRTLSPAARNYKAQFQDEIRRLARMAGKMHGSGTF